jgi:hypothetical protein
MLGLRSGGALLLADRFNGLLVINPRRAGSPGPSDTREPASSPSSYPLTADMSCQC